MKSLLFKKQILILCILGMVVISCSESEVKTNSAPSNADRPEAVSLLGQPLYSVEPSEGLLNRYNEHKLNYESDPQNVDKIIWYGRFTAYKGNYNEAIDIYTKAISLFPDESRLYRHRGHRYITIRKFDLAIEDFEKAVKLIENTPNQIEPDGMPNAKNIPESTLHGNIWYHLGLAYYLKHDF